MGTRGAYGFRLNGRDIVTYNHFDSYPSNLGVNILRELHKSDLDTLNRVARTIKLIPETEEDYWRLRDYQGKLDALLDGTINEMIDSADFLADSLFCEWAYIINLDENVFEVYKGYNKNPGAPGRYAHLRSDKEYYGVALVATYPLDNLPAIETFRNEDWFEFKDSILKGDAE